MRPIQRLSDSELSLSSRRQVRLSRAIWSHRRTENDGLENHYRRLIADNSPDELMARGVPEEFVTIATERLDGINEACNAILKERRV
jgi:hypothetical protein